MIQIIQRAKNQINRVAIKVGENDFTYAQLLQKSQQIAKVLLGTNADLLEARVAFMVQPGFKYVACQWAIWQAGAVAVPLCVSHPLPSLQYSIEDSQANIVVFEKEFLEVLQPLVHNTTIRFICLEEIENETFNKNLPLPEIAPSRRAMILYTSGTTNLPKGVVTTHANIEAQISTLIKAWEWTANDHILCILPLHHVHGIINVIGCALWAGGICEFLPKFNAESVFTAFKKGKINLFMAVPTIYFKLITALENMDKTEAQNLKSIMSKFRLMVSGSAALPVTVMEKWKQLSGHTLLERYGMTEIGMGISNPYIGERKAGFIGKPLPTVNVQLCNEKDVEIENEPGEIQIKGPNVFLEYFNKPEATAKTFTTDGWFKTGDIAVIEEGYYRILGRDSVDIIKSGGYKISALEIEEVLRKYPSISDCSVVGLPNEEWGEIVAVAMIINEQSIDLEALNTWLKLQLPTYKVPRKYKIMNELPRNAMGKVTKNDIKTLF